MKKFYLTLCVPGGGNQEVNKVFVEDRQKAIEYFNQYGILFDHPVCLDQNGYQKCVDGSTYVVSEPFEIGQ
jgi:hypothetical protein